MMEASYLTSLCKFGAEVGTRLVRLSKNVDGMPSTVKSLGFELWATCEVLCELAVIVTRARKDPSMSYFNDAALKELEDHVDTCDEIFHETARAVIVAYERIKSLRPKNKDGKEVLDKKIYISFGERTRWPLFQGRVRSMMEALAHAKMDMILQILVFWTSWESEARRRSTSSIFTQLTSATRVSLINQLWTNKVRREQDPDAQNIPNLSIKPPSISHSSTTQSQQSIFSTSLSAGSSPTNSSSGVSTLASFQSTSPSESKFKKMSRKLAKAIGLKSREDESEDESLPFPSSPQDDSVLRSDSRLHSRATSGARSYRSEASNGYSDHPSLRKSESMAASLRTEREYKSLLALTEGDPNALFQRPQPVNKTGTWTAGPTKGFKQGVALEWRKLMEESDELEWINDEGELAQNGVQEPRILGRRLLFTQLAAATPYYAVHDDEESNETVHMLLERCIEPGAIRKRVAEWEGMRRLQQEAPMASIDTHIRFGFR